MRETKEVTVQQNVWTAIVCDKCGVSVPRGNFAEYQEMFTYTHHAGYGSIFGDSVSLEIDLCQDCLKELLGPYMRESNE